MRRLAWLLPALLLAAPVAAQTPAEKLLEFAASGRAVPVETARREVTALYSQLGVPDWMRRDEPMAHWQVRVVPDGAVIDDMDHDILLVRGSVTLKRASFAVIVATGAVQVQNGAGLVIVANRDIRFRHNPNQDWSGVFVTRGRVLAPWVGNLVVHARGGIELQDSSAGLAAVGTEVRSRGPVQLERREARVFSDTPSARRYAAPSAAEAGYAGKRCRAGPPLARTAEAVTEIARKRARCGERVQLLIAACDRESDAAAEETWTVHLCDNVIAEVSARRTGGKDEFAFKPYKPNIPTSANAVTTTVAPPPGSAQQGVASYGTLKGAAPEQACSPGQEVKAADDLSRSGDYEGAIQQLDAGIARCDSGWALDRRGMLRLRRGDAAGALADLDRSVQKAWTSETPEFNRSLAYLFVGRPGDTVRELTRMLDKTPLRPNYLLYRGWAQLVQGRHLAACDDAEGTLQAIVLSKWGPGPNRSETAGRALILAHFACALSSQARRADALYAQWRSELRTAWPDAVAVYLREGGDPQALRGLAVHPAWLSELEGLLGLEDRRKGRPQAAAQRFAAARAAYPGLSFASALSAARVD